MNRYIIQDAIFGTKYAAYFTFRMRYFLPVTLTTLAINGVEFFLIRQLFSPELIKGIIIMRLYVGFAVGGWWGLLELMREYIRGRYHFHEINSANQSIACWLYLSLAIACIVLLAPMHYFSQQKILFNPVELNVYDLYLVGFCLHCLIQFAMATYRSGAFAIRRIYRPLKWVIGPGFLSLILMLTLWQFLGVVGLPIAFILGEFVDSIVRVYFIKATYRNLGLKPLQRLSFQDFIHFLAKVPLWNALKAYLAGLCLNIESLLILFFAHRLEFNPTLLVYSVILREIYRASSNWGSMFYFDFIKIGSGPYPLFDRRFMKKLFPVSVIISFIFSGIAFGFTQIFAPTYFFQYSLYIGTFFSVAAVISFIQIHAFSNYQWRNILVYSLLAVMITFFCGLFLPSSFGMMISLPTSLFFILIFLWKQPIPELATIKAVRKQSIYTLVVKLNKSKLGYQIFRLKIDQKKSRTSLDSFLSQIALEIDPSGWICPLRTNEFLFIEPNNTKQLTEASIKKIAPNFVQFCVKTEVADRIECLNTVRREIERNISNNIFYQEFCKNRDVAAIFRYHFAKGEKINLSQSSLIFNKSDKYQVYSSTEDFFLSPLTLLRKSPYQVSILFTKEPELYLLKKMKNNFSEVLSWNTFIHYVNFAYFANLNYNWKPND